MKVWTFLVMSLTAAFVMPDMQAATDHPDTSRLETMVIQDKGRRKPYLAFANESAITLTGRTRIKVDDRQWTSTELVTDIWLNPDNWLNRPVILVDYKPLRLSLGLDGSQKYFTYAQLVDSEPLHTMATEIQKLKARERSPKLNANQREAEQVMIRIETFQRLASGQGLKIVPTFQMEPGDPWATLSDLPKIYPPAKTQQVGAAFHDFEEAWNMKEQGTFNEATQAFVDSLKSLAPAAYPSSRVTALEHFYLTWHPFRLSWILFALALTVLLLTTSFFTKTGYKFGWALVILGFALQVFGFVCRVIITERAPVTNMYETIIWLAFGVTFFAIILEAIYKCRYYLLSALPVAIISLILADVSPSMFSSALNPLVPVLRNNFWLTVHVLSISSSYAAFALALGVAHLILYFLFFGKGDKSLMSSLYNYLYRALQIGVLLLASGTILGGVWANYSWGRFWDWDPKETWALITLLCYIIVLHGRIAGWWGGFGLTVGAILCFQSVLMAWYGVNFVLGVGLHSYGFGSGGFRYAIGFVIFELVLTVLALIKYQSFRGPTETVSESDNRT